MRPAIDFSILDKGTPVIMPIEAQKGARQYKTTTDFQNALQKPIGTQQGIEKLKIDISQGVKADPYPLLMTAIQIIANLTNDRAFYTVHRDVMQGMGMLEQMPAEWEQDRINTSLQKLVSCRQSIDMAITAHRQKPDGHPIGSKADSGDEYIRYLKQCFDVAYKFLDENKHARTNKDWERIVGNLSLYVDPLVADLVVAAVNELEREYKEFSAARSS
jgi:hypothetical protein